MATGSGDVVFALQRALPEGTQLLGMDFCQPMLDEAELKQKAHPSPRGPIQFMQGDGLALPLPDQAFDAITIAFGLRNMADRAKCLAEMRRVLRPGGTLFVLEFSQAWPFIRPFSDLHIHKVAPALAGWLTGDRAAYEYLGTSIEAFPGREALSAEIRAAGFSGVIASGMTMGVVALHAAQR